MATRIPVSVRDGEALYAGRAFLRQRAARALRSSNLMCGIDAGVTGVVGMTFWRMLYGIRL